MSNKKFPYLIIFFIAIILLIGGLAWEFTHQTSPYQGLNGPTITVPQNNGVCNLLIYASSGGVNQSGTINVYLLPTTKFAYLSGQLPFKAQVPCESTWNLIYQGSFSNFPLGSNNVTLYQAGPLQNGQSGNFSIDMNLPNGQITAIKTK